MAKLVRSAVRKLEKAPGAANIHGRISPGVVAAVRKQGYLRSMDGVTTVPDAIGEVMMGLLPMDRVSWIMVSESFRGGFTGARGRTRDRQFTEVL